MAITSRFQFVGNLIVPKDSSARPMVSNFEKDGKKMCSLNLGIKSGTSSAFIECFGSEQKTIYTMDVNGERMQIDWDDRLDPDVVDSVASYRRYVVDLGEEFGGRQEFVSAYDFIKFIAKNIGKYDGKLMATGTFRKEWYQKTGKYYDHFNVQNVYAVDAATHKDRLYLLMDVYYNKFSIDDVTFDDDKKIRLDGYIKQYINKDEGEKFIPMQFVLSAGKLNFENEKHQKIFDYKISYIYINNKTMLHIPWEISYVSGAEEVEFDESMLTDKQREQVELGLKTVEDFKPRGNILGERVVEYRLVDPKLTGEFSDGLVNTNLSPKEFEEMIYIPPKTEVLEDIEEEKSKKTTSKVKEEPEAEEDVDDLFA